MSARSLSFFLLILLALPVVLFAQEAKHPTVNIETVPAFPDALPWADTEDGVKTNATLALSTVKSIPAGSTLRMFYVKPVPTEAPVRIMGTDEQRRQAYSRDTRLPSEDSPVYGSPEVEAAIKVAHKTIWPNIASFRASLDLINLTDLRIVYMAPGAKDISDERITMPEGLLLEEKDGALVVCATVKGSSSQLSGLRAGDKIIALNGKDLTGPSATLAAFFAEYQTNAEQKIGNQKPYRFRILRGDAAAPMELSLRPPPSLTGSLLDQ